MIFRGLSEVIVMKAQRIALGVLLVVLAAVLILSAYLGISLSSVKKESASRGAQIQILEEKWQEVTSKNADLEKAINVKDVEIRILGDAIGRTRYIDREIDSIREENAKEIEKIALEKDAKKQGALISAFINTMFGKKGSK